MLKEKGIREKEGLERENREKEGKENDWREPDTAVQDRTEESYLISETARLVGVESHVLRYWEEELKLPIRRNELGHRYYTREDVSQFKEIKKLKEQGLQLKAIRTVLTDSSLQVMVPLREKQQNTALQQADTAGLQDKSARLQLLLHSMISQAVRENNEELTRELKETITKEMDYQFRVQEEESRKRDQEHLEKEEEHFRRLDELLRQYSGRAPGRREQREMKKLKKKEEKQSAAQEKKRKHSLF